MRKFLERIEQKTVYRYGLETWQSLAIFRAVELVRNFLEGLKGARKL